MPQRLPPPRPHRPRQSQRVPAMDHGEFSVVSCGVVVPRVPARPNDGSMSEAAAWAHFLAVRNRITDKTIELRRGDKVMAQLVR